MLYLKQKNFHERDKHIVFDEKPHLYYVNDVVYRLSVTKFIHSFFPSFNADKVISNMMNGKYWENSIYFGKTADEIKLEWKNKGLMASSEGTNLHKTIELYYNNELYENNSIEFGYFLNFHRNMIEKNGWEPYRTEWEIYDEEYKLAGSVDMLYKYENEYYIVDWKRCLNIKDTNHFESGFSPIEHLPNSNKWHYSLQLNTYKYIFEKKYNLKIAGMFLVVLHPDNKDFIKVDIDNMQEEIKLLLSLKKSF